MILLMMNLMGLFINRNEYIRIGNNISTCQLSVVPRARKKTRKQASATSAQGTWTTSLQPCGSASTRWPTSTRTLVHTTTACGTR